MVRLCNDIEYFREGVDMYHPRLMQPASKFIYS